MDISRIIHFILKAGSRSVQLHWGILFYILMIVCRPLSFKPTAQQKLIFNIQLLQSEFTEQHAPHVWHFWLNCI